MLTTRRDRFDTVIRDATINTPGVRNVYSNASTNEEPAESAPEESTESTPEESTESTPEESTESAPEESIEPAPAESTESTPEEPIEPAPEPATPASAKPATPAHPSPVNLNHNNRREVKGMYDLSFLDNIREMAYDAIYADTVDPRLTQFILDMIDSYASVRTQVADLLATLAAREESRPRYYWKYRGCKGDLEGKTFNSKEEALAAAKQAMGYGLEFKDLFRKQLFYLAADGKTLTDRPVPKEEVLASKPQQIINDAG